MSSLRKGSVEWRTERAVESFGCAASAIGPIERGMHLFAVTRGQWSMIDAVLHCLDQVGPSVISLWTWTVADYEIQCLNRLRLDGRVKSARLIIDYGARNKNAGLIRTWQSSFGFESVRFVVNHSKMATIESEDGRKLLLRGSMNLNFNPRFEQFDLTEGADGGFDLVRGLEEELPILPMACSNAEAVAASKVSAAFPQETLDLFTNRRVWAK